MPGRLIMTKPHGADGLDYPGDLALQLAELERGRAEGTVAEGRILGFLEEVRQVAKARDLEPWRARAIEGVKGAMVCWAWWELVVIAFPDLGERLGAGVDLALGLGCLALLYAGWSQLVYAHRRKASKVWFEGLEATIRRGGRIVDYLRTDANRQKTCAAWHH